MFNLEFTIHSNPDRDHGDWEEKHNISAPTVKELREKVLKFQGDNDIGGGNWGAAILHQDKTLVGYMSYNGRIWSKPYWEGNAVEILV